MPERLKVAYVTSRFPDGPGEAFFAPEIRALAALGARILVVPARPRKSATAYTGFSQRVLRLPIFGLQTLRLAVQELIGNPRRAINVLRIVLFSRYRFSTKCKNAAIAVKSLAVGRALRAEGIEHIHAQWLSTPSTVAFIASSLTGIPWSCTAHQFDIFQDNLLAHKARSARFIRVISTRNRDLLAERIPESSALLHVVHLGVCVPKSVLSAESNDVPRLLCAANFVAKKGHVYLLRALSLLRRRGLPFLCDLAGDGPLRATIESEIINGGLAACVFRRGYVEHATLCAELAQGKYSAFVLASTEEPEDFEGIPVSLMEAMAAGVACVTTMTGSISELIESGSTSYLVPQRDTEALADAIAHVLTSNAERIAVGEKARASITTRFNSEKTSAQLFAMIRSSSGAP